MNSKGHLKLLNETGVSGITGRSPVDLAMCSQGRFLYCVNADSGTVGAYRIEKCGHLTIIGEYDGLPVIGGAVGIAVR